MVEPQGRILHKANIEKEIVKEIERDSEHQSQFGFVADFWGLTQIESPHIFAANSAFRVVSQAPGGETKNPLERTIPSQ